MRLKPEPGRARVIGIRPEIAFAALVVDGVIREASGSGAVVTAGTDGTHSPGSKHYVGAALDVQSHGLDAPKVLKILQDRLGPDFDVILEDAGMPNEHFHVELDPKERL